MKKKIIALVILVAVVAVCFSGCTFIKKNEERQSNEVLAVISDKGFTLTITRNELLTYVNYMLNQYSQYGYTPDYTTLVPDVFDYLISQKYLVIVAMDYLKNHTDRKGLMAGENIAGLDLTTPEGILTVGERYAAIKTVNDTFESEIDTFVADYEKERRTALISEREDEIEAYLADGYEVDSVYIKEGSYKDEYLTGQTLDESKVFLVVALTKGEDKKEVDLPYSTSLDVTDFTFSTEADSSAGTVVEKSIKLKYDEAALNDDGETEYVTHTSDPVEYKLVKPRGTEAKEEEEVDPAVGSVANRYKKLSEIDADERYGLFDYNAGNTAALKEAYRQFRQSKKNMLINFDTNGLAYYYDSQYESAIISAFEHELTKTSASKVTDAMIKAEYDVLLARQAEEYSVLTDKEKVDKFVAAIKGSNNINLESTYYIPVDAILAEGYKMSDFFAIAHILFKFNDQQSTFITTEGAGRSDEAIKELRELTSKYITTNRSNPDYDAEFECPFHSDLDTEAECTKPDGTAICPAIAYDPDGAGLKLFGEGGDEGIFEEISRVLDALPMEERFDVFKKYMSLYNDDGGALASTTGYFIPPEGIAHSYDGDDFPNLARALLAESATVGNTFVNGSLGYAFTTYGLHIMAISFMPFADAASYADNALAINAELNLAGDTHYSIIKKTLEESEKKKAYNEYVASYTREQALEKATKDEGRFKKLLKDLGLD